MSGYGFSVIFSVMIAITVIIAGAIRAIMVITPKVVTGCIWVPSVLFNYTVKSFSLFFEFLNVFLVRLSSLRGRGLQVCVVVFEGSLSLGGSESDIVFSYSEG